MEKDFHYKCNDCGRIYAITADLMLCPYCSEEYLSGKPLRGILKVILPKYLSGSKRPGEDFDLFDYLPVEKQYFPGIPVGNTPLVRACRLEEELNYENIYLKFDGMNPTGSYKDRASYLVSAFARKNCIKEIVVASTGNAASSMAGIAASADQKVFVFMPSSAPRAKLIQCLQYGACLIPVKGNYDEAFDLSLGFSRLTGYLNRNTAFNPLTIEGKKTAAFEIAGQLRNKNVDYVFLPVGDGVILDGIIKGFCDLKQIGLITKIPRIIGVQAEKSAYIYRAFKENLFDTEYVAETIADSISVNVARNAYSAVKSLREADGDIVVVSDEEILLSQKLVAEKSGLFCEPSSAAAFAGFAKIRDTLPENKNVVVLLTGNGLKDIETAAKNVQFPEIFQPDLEFIMKRLRVLGEIEG